MYIQIQAPISNYCSQFNLTIWKNKLFKNNLKFCKDIKLQVYSSISHFWSTHYLSPYQLKRKTFFSSFFDIESELVPQDSATLQFFVAPPRCRLSNGKTLCSHSTSKWHLARDRPIAKATLLLPITFLAAVISLSKCRPTIAPNLAQIDLTLAGSNWRS